MNDIDAFFRTGESPSRYNRNWKKCVGYEIVFTARVTEKREYGKGMRFP